jgi:hypothetical protein
VNIIDLESSKMNQTARNKYPVYQSFWLSENHLKTIKKAAVIYGVKTKARALRLMIEKFESELPKQP